MAQNVDESSLVVPGFPTSQVVPHSSTLRDLFETAVCSRSEHDWLAREGSPTRIVASVSGKQTSDRCITFKTT